jgi:hypothetical protein
MNEHQQEIASTGSREYRASARQIIASGRDDSSYALNSWSSKATNKPANDSSLGTIPKFVGHSATHSEFSRSRPIACQRVG